MIDLYEGILGEFAERSQSFFRLDLGDLTVQFGNSSDYFRERWQHVKHIRNRERREARARAKTSRPFQTFTVWTRKGLVQVQAQSEREAIRGAA